MAIEPFSGYLYGMIATVDNKMNVYYAPVEELNNDKIAWKRLMKPSDEIYDWAATEEDIYLLTPKNASNFKILKTSIHEPDIENAKVIIPEDPEGHVFVSVGLDLRGGLLTESQTILDQPLAPRQGREICAGGLLYGFLKVVHFESEQSLSSHQLFELVHQLPSKSQMGQISSVPIVGITRCSRHIVSISFRDTAPP